jgi:hypothetical protein
MMRDAFAVTLMGVPALPRHPCRVSRASSGGAIRKRRGAQACRASSVLPNTRYFFLAFFLGAFFLVVFLLAGAFLAFFLAFFLAGAFLAFFFTAFFLAGAFLAFFFAAFFLAAAFFFFLGAAFGANGFTSFCH